MPQENTQLAPPNGDDGSVDFHHPYTPYDVQLHFMRAVYDVLQRGQGQIGILESPTGTVRYAVLFDARRKLLIHDEGIL